MKRTLLISTVLLLLGVTAAAQLPPRGNIGLYADGARAYSSCCPIPPGFAIAKIEMWVWCMPSENGLWGVDFAVGYPSNIIRDRLTYSGHLAATTGDPVTGVAARFDACQWSACWVAHQTLFVNSLQQTYLEILPHPGQGVFQFYSCAAGNPAEPCLKGATLFLNAASPCLPPETTIGADGPTWGTLKALFAE